MKKFTEASNFNLEEGNECTVSPPRGHDFFITSGAEAYEDKSGTVTAVHQHCGTNYVTLAFSFDDGDTVFTFDIDDLYIKIEHIVQPYKPQLQKQIYNISNPNSDCIAKRGALKYPS